MAVESEQLKAARASGDLSKVVGVLKDEGIMEMANAGTTVREQVGLEDSAIRVAAGLAGKSGAERRAALREVRPGSTVTSKGVAKTLLSRAEKISRVKAWASGMSEEARTEYMIGEKYAALSENAQDVIADAFTELENDEYSTPADVSGFDFNAETMDVDQLPEDETETVGDSFEVQAGEDVESFDIDDAEPWPGDAV
jgi:hypothetical protein